MVITSARAPNRTRTDLGPHLPHLRAALEQQRQFRTEQLAGLAAAPRPASAEHAEVDRALRGGAAAALADIEVALRDLAQGTYGRCRDCDTAISLERLEILPSSSLCADCLGVRQGR